MTVPRLVSARFILHLCDHESRNRTYMDSFGLHRSWLHVNFDGLWRVTLVAALRDSTSCWAMAIDGQTLPGMFWALAANVGAERSSDR